MTLISTDDIEVVEQVPLGYHNLPAAISQLGEAKRIILESVNAVPDFITGDCDLLEIVADLDIVTRKAQEHLERAARR